MDLFDRDDSLFHDQEQSEAEAPLDWNDNIFGERLDREEASGTMEEPEMTDDSETMDDHPLAS